MDPESDALLDVAAAIADGSGIDWNLVAGGVSGPEQQNRVEQLRLIKMIADMHQGQESASQGDHEEQPVRAGDASTSPPVGNWGGLLLLEEIGQGSFGTVYRAHDPQLDRPVAVKLLRRTSTTDEQLASRLLREGQTLARVRHPNVVTVYGAGTHEGRVGLWMEFVRGLTLEQMLQSHGAFSGGEAALVGHELCGALAAVHIAGLVHRDIKAQNVMREEGGRLVLMDFGAGQKRSDTGGRGTRIVGTPLYMAPEVLSGGEATIRSDIYNLGVLLYHLVTNDFPVKGRTLEELVSAHARGETTPLPDVRPHLPAPFLRVVERATHPDPAKRFASAGALQAALAQIPGAGAQKAVTPRLRTGLPKARSGDQFRRGSAQSGASVAVLPFTDMSAAKDQEWFCDGITEELISALAQIPGLRVAARSSAFQFKGQSRDIRHIGDALTVATVLDGSVRRDGNRLRITVELIGSADGYHLWSDRFDRDVDDVFAVQTEIAAAVAVALKGTLAGVRSPVAAVTSRSRDIEAYESYLEGRYHWNKRTEDELQKSVDCFERAIERDPGYAQAFAGMADAYLTLGTYGALPPSDVMARTKRALKKALEIDNRLAEAYTCRGCVRSVYDWAWDDAAHDFLRAIELDPSYPTAHHWYAINHLVPQGRFDHATDELRAALRCDPLALAVNTSVGMKSYFAHQYDDAVKELKRTIGIDATFGMARLFLGATYTEQEKYSEALDELEAAIRLSGRSPDILAALGYLYGRSGEVARAREVLEELKQIARARYVSPAKIAQLHVGLGERAEALKELEAAHDERAGDLAWLGVRPVFATLRDEPRFSALLGTIGLTPFQKSAAP
jgi:TolB-like protein/Tfp pilus assembly protein PilF